MGKKVYYVNCSFNKTKLETAEIIKETDKMVFFDRLIAFRLRFSRFDNRISFSIPEAKKKAEQELEDEIGTLEYRLTELKTKIKQVKEIEDE